MGDEIKSIDLPRPASDAGELYLMVMEVVRINRIGKMGLSKEERIELIEVAASISNRMNDKDHKRCDDIIAAWDREDTKREEELDERCIGITNEVVIDGQQAMKVRMVKPPIEALAPGCGDGNHCAAHGNGPFSCCKCGAEFSLI